MSITAQHAASERADSHRGNAEQLAQAFTDERQVYPADIQIAMGLAAIVHLLLAIDDRLNYGAVSILDGTVSCRVCRVIVLEENSDGHAAWHAGERGQ